MKPTRLLAAAIALAAALPLAARADCTTPEGRETVHIKYRQAMAAWSQSDPQGYADAQEEFKSDTARLKQYPADSREQRECGIWQKYISLSHKQQ